MTAAADPMAGFVRQQQEREDAAYANWSLDELRQLLANHQSLRQQSMRFSSEGSTTSLMHIGMLKRIIARRESKQQ